MPQEQMYVMFAISTDFCSLTNIFSVSRASLFDDFNNDSSSDELEYNYGGEPDFEFVDVDVPEESITRTVVAALQHEEDDIPQEVEEEPEMEMFKLFNTEDTQAISLRDDIEENIVNERPESYYYASYSVEQRDQFGNVAVSFEQVVRLGAFQRNISSDFKLLDADAYNKAIEKAKLEKKKRGRPGKKKRTNKIACRERKLERKKIETAKAAALKKKKFHKRGGKKNKKKEPAVTNAKPKYRTE